ncbi:MAG: cytochrome c-type biogenesis protein CcmH [Cryomorphaceae bacterium]|jgi:cytochrome c-type biogenesis protein CcmH
MLFRKLLLSVCLALYSLGSFAIVEQVVFPNEEMEQRYSDLIAEFRCLVCQNQNLADSNAELAKDLRRKTAELLKAGDSDADIRKYMRDRYGDFVSYRPAFNARTALLWLGPVAVLLFVLLGLVFNIRRRQNDEALRPTRANDEAQRVKVRNLMREAPQLNSSTPPTHKDD